MQGKALKLLMILQFAVMVGMPCRCIFAQLRAPDRAAASDCCRGGSCGIAIAQDRFAAADELTVELDPASQRHRFCPGCLLPDLAPPPLDPADDCSHVSAGVASVSAHVEPLAALTNATDQRLALNAQRAAPHTSSLLRLHCALIL